MKLDQLKSLVAEVQTAPVATTILAEAYEDRVTAAVNHIVTKFKEQHPTKELILTALHDYATEHRVPDYNGPTKTKNIFVKDVLDGLKDKIKYARKSADGHLMPPKKVKDDEYYSKIYHTVEGIISNVFPDGDPIDRMGPWMNRNDISMDDVNKAFKKAGQGSYDKYLIDMWDQMAETEIYDAKNGHINQHSPFYDVDKDGTIKPRQNPWK